MATATDPSRKKIVGYPDDPMTASRQFPNRSYPGGRTDDPNAPPGSPPTPPNPPAPPPPPPAPPETKPADPWGGRQDAGTYAAATDKSTWDSNEFNAPAWTPTRYNQNAISGYDVTKWSSPTHQTPKYVVGRILSGYDLNDPNQLKLAIADIQRAYPGTTHLGGDRINFPGVGIVDVIRDFGGESGIAWQPESANQPPAGTGTGTGTGTGAVPSAATGAAPLSPTATGAGVSGLSSNSSLAAWLATQNLTSTPTPTDPTMDAARRTAILDLLQRQPPTAQELRDSPENQAYQLQSQRAAERSRAELAENAAYEGFDNTGYFDTEVAGINQQRAEGEAGFLGQVAISRMTAQREDLKFAIQEAQQSGQFDLAQQLDRQRMVLDAAINKEQLDLDQKRLGESTRQFNARLGYDYATEAQRANEWAIEYATPKS